MAMFCVIIVILITLMTGFVNLNRKKSEIKELEKQIKSQKTANAEINDLLKADDLELIERYARDKLGYGYANEKVYIDISGK